MDWEKQFRKYVWDDDKTPYFTPISDLNRRQASNEIYIFTLFLGTLFAVVALLANTGALPHGRSFGVALYAFTMVCALIVLGFTKHPIAAWYCAAAPIATLFYFYGFRFGSESSIVDHVAVVAVAALWLRYSWRVVGISRRFEDMPQPDPPDES